MQKKKILIAGYYGLKNTGDEAILSAMLADIKSQNENVSFTIVSGDIQDTKKRHGVQAVDWSDVQQISKVVEKSDLIILGGGGLFQDYWGVDKSVLLTENAKRSSIPYYGSFAYWAALYNKPFMIYAVGVGPLGTEEGKELTSSVFSMADSVTLRDNYSKEILVSLGIPEDTLLVTSDPVLNLVSSDKDRAKEILLSEGIDCDNEKLVGVTIRNWRAGGEKANWHKNLSSALDKLIDEHNVKILFIPFQVGEEEYDDDRLAAYDVTNRMKYKKNVVLLPESYSVDIIAGMIGCVDILVGMRLHSLIFAVNESIPFIGLVYDPKVNSFIESLKLGEYAHNIEELDENKLFRSIDKAWRGRIGLQERLDGISSKQKERAKLNAQRALLLLDKPVSLAKKQIRYDVVQNFLIQQIYTIKQRKDFLKEQDIVLQSLSQQISAVKNSAIWHRSVKVRKVYETLFPLGSLQYSIIRKTKSLLSKINFSKVAKKTTHNDTGVEDTELLWQKASKQVVADVLSQMHQRSTKGVFILTSAFVFDGLYNQRVINFAKFLAENNWTVLYIAWRWNKDETMPSIGEEVYPNIFQIPVDMFLHETDAFETLPKDWKKYFVVEFPHPDFVFPSIFLKSQGFQLIYEIIDDWEGFFKVDQAMWFDQQKEEFFLTNADFLTATSPILIEKFLWLRKDIHLSPNGYDPSLLGEVQARDQKPHKEIHLGYFGHLTSSWFDWDFLDSIIELATLKDIYIHIHIIGYGEPEIEQRMAKHPKKITFYGKIPPTDLYKYAKTWDAGFIFFKESILSQSVDPIKLYEYLYFGLPVLVRGISYLKNAPFTDLVDNAAEVIAILADIQQNGYKRYLGEEDKRNIFLAEATWEKRFEKNLHLLNEKQ